MLRVDIKRILGRFLATIDSNANPCLRDGSVELRQAAAALCIVAVIRKVVDVVGISTG